MTGKIEITVHDKTHIQVHVDMKGMSCFDKALLMDSLGRALKLDKADRMTIGALITVGGFGALSGRPPEMVEIDLDMIKKMKENKENNNETDAL